MYFHFLYLIVTRALQVHRLSSYAIPAQFLVILAIFSETDLSQNGYKLALQAACFRKLLAEQVVGMHG